MHHLISKNITKYHTASQAVANATSCRQDKPMELEGGGVGSRIECLATPHQKTFKTF